MNGEIKYLSLFSGAGGGDLACQHLLGWSCVGYVEWNKDACETLDRRIRDGFADNAPVWHQDIRDFNRGAVHVYPGMVDFITGGPPCQPFSVAGRRAGSGDSRNMVPAMLRTIGIVRPRRILLENSPTSTFRRYLLEFIIPRLHQMGYVGRYGVVSAEDAIWLNCYPGIPARYHERKRTWVIAKIANANSGQRAFVGTDGRMGRLAQPIAETVAGGWWSTDPAEMSDASRDGCDQGAGLCEEEQTKDGRQCPSRDLDSAEINHALCGRYGASQRQICTRRNCIVHADRRPVESRVGRVVHGMARRLDRCRAIGEGQVPEVVDFVEEILNHGF